MEHVGKEEPSGRNHDVVHALLMSGMGLQGTLDSGTDFYAQGSHERIDDGDDAGQSYQAGSYGA